MKKFLLFLMSAFISMQISAQNLDKPDEPYYFYCQVLSDLTLSGKMKVRILWNDQNTGTDICNEKGERIEFKTMVDVMNYMSKRGWDFVDSKINPNGSVYYYMFRKLVKSDEEAKKGIYFKENFKK